MFAQLGLEFSRHDTRYYLFRIDPNGHFHLSTQFFSRQTTTTLSFSTMADEDIDLSKDTHGTTGKADIAVGTVPVVTATAIPVVSHPTTFATDNIMSHQALSTLRAQGFPLGLAQELGNTKAKYPIRFWIVDNSG
jgi:hypothetical protein